MKPKHGLLGLVIMSICFLWGQFYVFWHDSTALVKAAMLQAPDLSRSLESRLSDVKFRAVADSVAFTLLLVVNCIVLIRSHRKSQS